MISLNIQVIQDDCEAVTVRARKRMTAANNRAAKKVVSLARASMKEPKHGVIYQRPGRRISYMRAGRLVSYTRGGSHQASAPGEAPAIDTRELYKSFEIIPQGYKSIDVVVSAEHADDLEFGTRDMDPRPFLTPAVEAVEEQWEGELIASIY